MFTYSGWNAAAYMAEEIRDPGRNVPRALALGTGAVDRDLPAVNALYLYVLPVAELAPREGSVLDVIADRLIGPPPATSWASSSSSACRPASTR